MNTRRNISRGFTIIEVIVIIVIIGVIASVVAPRLLTQISKSKQAMAAANASSLANAMQTYLADCGTPDSSATIDILYTRPSNVDETKWHGPYVQKSEDLVDPWGHKFELKIPGGKNFDFDIISYGADGQPGGEGENADVIKP